MYIVLKGVLVCRVLHWLPQCCCHLHTSPSDLCTYALNNVVLAVDEEGSEGGSFSQGPHSQGSSFSGQEVLGHQMAEDGREFKKQGSRKKSKKEKEKDKGGLFKGLGNMFRLEGSVGIWRRQCVWCRLQLTAFIVCALVSAHLSTWTHWFRLEGSVYIRE